MQGLGGQLGRLPANAFAAASTKADLTTPVPRGSPTKQTCGRSAASAISVADGGREDRQLGPVRERDGAGICPTRDLRSRAPMPRGKEARCLSLQRAAHSMSGEFRQ